MTDSNCCSLEPEAFDERAAAWKSLGKALMACQATPTGARLRYRLEAGLGKVLLDLLEAERECCPTLSFWATVDVTVDAPAEARSWVRQMFLAGGTHARSVEAGHAGRIQEAVASHYASAAAQVSACGESPGRCQDQVTGIGQSVYSSAELEGLPGPAVAGSIGCANPVAVAELHPGETVLDLGSGGGLDVLLSARRVAPTGKAYGLEMTDEMLNLARANKAAAGVSNAEFLKGHMETIPLPAASVDVVVSNCVISLSVDKNAVFAEAHRVLRPGARLVVADVVADVEPTAEQRSDVDAWVTCMAGALTREQYGAALERAGFADVSLQDSHPVADSFTSVIVTATKPTAV
jgi:arsenite methyltransferase